MLTEQVPDRYLAFLRSRGVSYLFGGKSRVDRPKILRKLRGRFGIRKLLLEGGGKINGSFLAAGLVDELSLLIAPVADGASGRRQLFDAREGSGPARHLKLLSVERRRGDLLWVRYGCEADGGSRFAHWPDTCIGVRAGFQPESPRWRTAACSCRKPSRWPSRPLTP